MGACSLPRPAYFHPFLMLPSVLLYRSLLLSLNVISSQVLWISNCEASLLCMCLRVCVRARACNLHREILYRHETHNISRETTERGRWRYRVFHTRRASDDIVSPIKRYRSNRESSRAFFPRDAIFRLRVSEFSRIYVYVCIARATM